MGTGISFSGVGSGLPIQDWISQLVSARRLPLDNLYAKKNKLGNVKNNFKYRRIGFQSFQLVSAEADRCKFSVEF